MRQLLAMVIGVWMAAAGAAFAQSGNGPVVVELFTSQGCSSCPAADAVLADIARRDDVIALALHVDYWDYLGWKDKFADSAYSARQRDYARKAGARNVYTPQMIVGGMDHIVGARPAELGKLIGRYAARPQPVTLRLARNGGVVEVQAPAASLPRGSVVQLVRYTPLETVDIKRGENAGRRIDYANVVTSWKKVADWDGRSELSLSLKAGGNGPVVVIVQEPGMGPILAAAELR